MIDENLIKEYTIGTLQVRKILSRRQNAEFSMHQFVALTAIARYQDEDNRECNVSEITAFTDMAMPNVVRMLNEMQLKDLITRRREGRVVYVSITDKGRKYLNHCIEIADGQMKELIEQLHASDVSDEEINAFLTTAIKLNKLQLKYSDKKYAKR